MAKNKYALDFEGFLDLADKVEQMNDRNTLTYVAKNALDESKKYVQKAVDEAMSLSTRYHYKKGEKYATGRMLESSKKVSGIESDVVGTRVTAYIGFDLAESPEAVFALYGTPHKNKDAVLYRAVKVKGAIRKNVDKIQAQVFNNAVAGIFDTSLTAEDYSALDIKIKRGINSNKQHKEGV